MTPFMSMLFAFLSFYALEQERLDQHRHSIEGYAMVRILERQTAAPLQYASVYVIPKNDTLITNFSLSDTSGVAKLENVERGLYVLHVEMLGYHPYEEERYHSGTDTDWGDILLEADVNILKEARITATRAPFEFYGDSIVFNAASFPSGNNYMLADILRHMPGIEVSSAGVTYNGRPISRITVDGHTYFFDDQNTALHTIPAEIVEKVSVVDKKSETAMFTGIDEEREIVMDIRIHQLFRDRWFGYIGAVGGITLSCDSVNHLVGDRKGLWAGNAMLTGNGTRERLTAIASIQNADISGMDALEEETGAAIGTEIHAGVNYNTQRIRGFENNVAMNWDDRSSYVQNQSLTTVFFSNNQITDITVDSLFDRMKQFRITMSAKKEGGEKYLLSIIPSFATTQITKASSNYTQRLRDNVNHASSSDNSMSNNGFDGNIQFKGGIKDIGKNGRSLVLKGSASFNSFSGNERTYSVSDIDSGLKDVIYLLSSNSCTGSIRLDYVEPIARSFSMSATVFTNIAHKEREHLATLQPSLDDILSSTSESFDSSVGGNLLFQRNYGDDMYIQFGGSVEESLRELQSVSQGTLSESGIGEWRLSWSPFVDFRKQRNGRTISLHYSSEVTDPEASERRAEIDVTNPMLLSIGNIYLMPGYSSTLSTEMNLFNEKHMSFYSIIVLGQVQKRNVVHARWLTRSGQEYAVPVNAHHPSFSINFHGLGTIPIGFEGRLLAMLSLQSLIKRAVSYQAAKDIPAILIDSFDYTAFMDSFWGNSSGDRFYAGESGFGESQTWQFSLATASGIKWRGDKMNTSLSGKVQYDGSRYSLDKKANTDTWNLSLAGDAHWKTSIGLDVRTGIIGRFFWGYQTGYDTPYVSLNSSLSKSLGPFTFALECRDLFDSNRSRRRIVTDNYVTDANSSVLGRRFHVSMKWNFGMPE